MPSPVGHVIAGAAIGWVAESLPPLRGRIGSVRGAGRAPGALTPLAGACAVLALTPDLDILAGTHRTFTHSIAAVALAAFAGALIARARRAPGLAVAIACGCAVGSHIVFDWLGRDSSTPAGLMALWPLSTAYFYSGIDLFAEVSRRYWKPDEFIFKNAISVARELLILGPPAAAIFWLRQQRFARTTGSQRGSGTAEPRSPNPESRSSI